MGFRGWSNPFSNKKFSGAVTLMVTLLAALTITGLALVSCSSPSIRDDRSVISHGEASWYGKRFQGQKTASGEIFDAELLTAAHPTLAFGTYVEVRNVATEKSVVVKINDRNKGFRNRIIDLSEAAAKKIGLLEQGTGQVELLIAR